MLLALLLALPGPAAAQEAVRNAPYPREEMRLVLGAGFATILERHLDAATPADLLIWSLSGLVTLDPSLTVRRRGQEVELYRGEDALLSRPSANHPGACGHRPRRRRSGGCADPVPAGRLGGLPHAAPGLPRHGLIRESYEAVFIHLDPFSRYITPEEAQAARERRTGEAGLGLRLAPGRGAGAVVAALSANGPAAQAGLRIGDRILAIDGVALRTRDAGTAAGLLEGPAGSEVILLVESNRRRREVTLQRILPPGSPVTTLREGDALVIRIPSFTAQTQRQTAAAIQAAFDQGNPRAIVLDLRGNRGGLLSQAASVADIFLGGGEVFRTQGRHPDSSRIYVGAPPDLSEGLPLVVLVDGRTASSAEILAASLSDRGRAAVVGTVTTGKGLVQLVIALPDGGELLMSWSRLIMPNGWPLQGVGVLPGLCTAGGPEAVAMAMTALRAGARPMGVLQARVRRLRAPVPLEEAEAIRAACPPGTVPDSDVSVAVALALDPIALAAALPR